MTDPIKRRLDNKERASKMSGREISETTFVELLELNYHIREDINGKVKTLWSAWTWGTWTAKALGAGSAVLIVILKLMGKI